ASAPTARLDSAFTVEHLAKVRDALLAAVEQARQVHARVAAAQIAQPTAAEPTPADTLLSPPQRVMVQSENDRLAMIPYRTAAVEPTPIAETAPAADAAPTDSPRPTTTPQAELRHRPAALIAQLEALSVGPGAQWAERVLAPIEELSR